MKISKSLFWGLSTLTCALCALQVDAAPANNPEPQFGNLLNKAKKAVKDKVKETVNDVKETGTRTLEKGAVDVLSYPTKGTSINKGNSSVGRTVGNQTTNSTTSGNSYKRREQQNTREFNTTAMPDSFGLEIPREAKRLHMATCHSAYRYTRNYFAEPRVTSSTVHLVLDYDHNVYFSDFHDGVAYVADDNKAFYIDKQGNVLFETELRESDEKDMPRFCNGVVIEQPGIRTSYKKVRIRDKKGNIIKELESPSCSHLVDGVAAILVKKPEGQYGQELRYIDSKGNFIFPELTSDFSSGVGNVGGIKSLMRKSSEGLTAFAKYIPKQGNFKWGFRDASGHIVIEPKYDAVADFKDGMAAVCVVGQGFRNVKWGFVDKSGNEAIPPTYTNMPSDFDSGLARVITKNDEAYIIDKRGNKVKGPFSNQNDLEYISPFFNGYAIMGKKMNYGDDSYRIDETVYGTVDTNFNMKSWANREAFRLDWSTPVAEMDGNLYLKNDSWGTRKIACLNPANLDVNSIYLCNPFVEGLSRYDSRQSSSNVGYVNGNNEFTIVFEKNEF